MSRSGPARRWRRVVVALFVVCVGHAAFMIWLAMQVHPASMESETPAVQISLGAGPPGGSPHLADQAARPVPAPSPPLQPQPIEPLTLQPQTLQPLTVDQPSPVAVLPPPPPLVPASESPHPPPPTSAAAAPSNIAAATANAAGAASGAGGCAIFDQVQARLQSDPNVLAALRLIPKASRSVANAIQVWDGRWISPAAPGALSPIAPIQTAVVQTVAASPPACRTAQVRGPRFVIVNEGEQATVVSLGSDSWTWADLVTTSNLAVAKPQ